VGNKSDKIAIAIQKIHDVTDDDFSKKIYLEITDHLKKKQNIKNYPLFLQALKEKLKEKKLDKVIMKKSDKSSH
jgi:hypothetical protein